MVPETGRRFGDSEALHLSGGGTVSCGGDHPPGSRRERQRGGNQESGPVAGIGGPEDPIAPVPVLPTVSDDGQAAHTGGAGVPIGGCGEGVPGVCLYW